MKYSFLAFFILCLSSYSQADIAEDVSLECSSNPEIVKQKGLNGSCRAVLAPSSVTTKGACRAQEGDLICLTVYATQSIGSAMRLTCYTDPKNPLVDITFGIKVSAMRAAFIIKRPDGANYVVNSNKQYLNLSSENVIVSIVEDQKTQEMSADIVIMTEQGPATFKKAPCHKI